MAGKDCKGQSPTALNVMECHTFNDPRIQQIAESYGWVYAGVQQNTPELPHIHMWCRVKHTSSGDVPEEFKTEDELVTAFGAML